MFELSSFFSPVSLFFPFEEIPLVLESLTGTALPSAERANA